MESMKEGDVVTQVRGIVTTIRPRKRPTAVARPSGVARASRSGQSRSGTTTTARTSWRSRSPRRTCRACASDRRSRSRSGCSSERIDARGDRDRRPRPRHAHRVHPAGAPRQDRIDADAVPDDGRRVRGKRRRTRKSEDSPPWCRSRTGRREDGGVDVNVHSVRHVVERVAPNFCSSARVRVPHFHVDCSGKIGSRAGGCGATWIMLAKDAPIVTPPPRTVDTNTSADKPS